MNNYEWLKTQSLDDMAHVLCGVTECDHCPVFYRCHIGHNGFKDWLEDKHETKQRK